MNAWDLSRKCDSGFLIGVSAYSLEEPRAAEVEGTDSGPIFFTSAKTAYGPPQGLRRLRETVSALPSPSSHTDRNAPQRVAAGAARVDAIPMFQSWRVMAGVQNRLAP